MARWVLPVLVGPRTAVTPAPRARASREAGDENESDIRFPGWEWPGPLRARLSVPQCDAGTAPHLNKRTSLERIGPESLTLAPSAFVLPDISVYHIEKPQHRVTKPHSIGRNHGPFVNTGPRRLIAKSQWP